MITTTQLIENLKVLILDKLNTLKTTQPLIGIAEPFITRALNNKIGNLHTFLDLISDGKGNIDIDTILQEVSTNLVNSKPFSIEVPILKTIKIGGGIIEFDIPYINKSIILNSQDIIKLKEMITSKS